MTSKFDALDVSSLRTESIEDRMSKVSVESFGQSWQSGGSLRDFIGSLPHILAGNDLRTVVDSVVAAYDAGKPVIISMGAHVIKCGLSPVINDLIRRGVVSAVALNGAGAIHDSEIAFYGRTSEDVVTGMQTGMFGMARETSCFLNETIAEGAADGCGAGESLGRAIAERQAAYASHSILATAYQCSIPATVHISIGCDIVHMHPNADGAGLGRASLRDFRVLANAMKGLGGGGVLVNFGSAVVLPEVILKAVTVLRNLGYPLTDFLGVNVDFVQHYRSNQQIVARVREIGGRGISLTGHHEIMIPLIAAAVVQGISEKRE